MPNAQVLEAKKATVSALADQMKGATAGVFVDYKGITVEQDTKLRNDFREAGVSYSVVKNTLTRLAARECGYDFDELLNGTTSFAVTTGDPIAPARIVSQFAKQNKILAIKGGTMRINPEHLSCELYRFCSGDVRAFNEFHGEYMNGYSWASMTESFMTWKHKELRGEQQSVPER